MNIIMIDQVRATQARQYRRENRNMVKFIGMIFGLMVLVSCVSEWFLV